MKLTALALLLTTLLINPALAQKKVEKTLAWNTGKTIFLNLNYASDIVVKTWNKNEISVSATVNLNNNADNDEFTLISSESATEIQVKSDIPRLKDIARMQTSRPKGNSYYSKGGYWDDEKKVYVQTGKQVSADISYEIFVPEVANLRLKTIDGNVKLAYTSGKYEIESISGKIDLSLPEKQPCSLSLKTITGEIYSNLPLQFPEEQKKGDLELVGGGRINQHLRAKLNGGGTEISLKTISSDILLRKK